MNQISYATVTKDLFRTQFSWVIRFLEVMLVIHVGKMIFSFFDEVQLNTFFAMNGIAANLFMLVIGIISSLGLIKHYVGHEITRKAYFYGATFASASLSVIIPLIAALVTYIVSFIIDVFNLSIVLSSYENESIDYTGHIIGDAVMSIVMTPVLEEGNMMLAILIFAVNLFSAYLVGWLIGAAFSQPGAIIGIVCVVIGIAVLYIGDVLLYGGLGKDASPLALDIPMSIAMVALLAICGFVLSLIRLITTKAVIKL